MESEKLTAATHSESFEQQAEERAIREVIRVSLQRTMKRLELQATNKVTAFVWPGEDPYDAGDEQVPVMISSRRLPPDFK